MLSALHAGRQSEYFHEVVAAPLYLPHPRTSASPADGQQFVTAELFGQTFLLAFTSQAAMASALTDVVDSYVTTDYAELREKWPVSTWQLALNPGTPIDAYLTIEAVAEVASGALTLPMAVDAALGAADMPDASPPVDSGLRGGPDADPGRVLAEDPAEGKMSARLEATPGLDAVTLLDRLVDSVVLVPASREVEPADLLDPEFPWLMAVGRDEEAVSIFTSSATMRQGCSATTPFLEVAFPFLAAVWPDRFCLLIDAGSSNEIRISGDLVAQLALWGVPIGGGQQPSPATP